MCRPARHLDHADCPNHCLRRELLRTKIPTLTAYRQESCLGWVTYPRVTVGIQPSPTLQATPLKREGQCVLVVLCQCSRKRVSTRGGNRCHPLQDRWIRLCYFAGPFLFTPLFLLSRIEPSLKSERK